MSYGLTHTLTEAALTLYSTKVALVDLIFFFSLTLH